MQRQSGELEPSGYAQHFTVLLLFLLVAMALTLAETNGAPRTVFLFQLIGLVVVALRYLRNNLVLAFLLFILPYFLVAKYFVFDGIPISAWPDGQTYANINLSVVLNLLFLLGFTLGLRHVSNLELQSQLLVGRAKNTLAFYTFLLLGLLSVVWGIGGDTIFEQGGYNPGSNRRSTLHEFFILFLFGQLVTTDPSSVRQRSVMVLLTMGYIAKTLLYGGRIEILQVLLLLGFARNHLFVSSKFQLLTVAIVGLFLSSAVAAIRADPLALLDGDLNRLLLTPQREYISNQFGDAYQAGLRILQLIDSGYLSFEERVVSLCSVVFGFALPSRMLPEQYNLAAYKQALFGSGGGGIITAHAYAWASVAGPFVAGLLVGTAFRAVYSARRLPVYAYGVMVVVTFPRWFAYYPAVLFRMCVYAAAIALVIRPLRAIGKRRYDAVMSRGT